MYEIDDSQQQLYEITEICKFSKLLRLIWNFRRDFETPELTSIRNTDEWK